jgi:hypothetical protein
VTGMQDGEPEAHIRRVGRWTYYVTVTHGIISWGPDGGGWHVLGRKRAHRKAEWALRRYQLSQRREADVETITRPTQS